MIKKIKKLLTEVLDELENSAVAPEDMIIVNADQLAAATGPPELRVVGLFSDVNEENVAELVHGILYLNEANKVKEDNNDIFDFSDAF